MNSSVLRNPKKGPQAATHDGGANTPAAITVELPEARTAEQKWADAGQIMSVFVQIRGIEISPARFFISN